MTNKETKALIAKLRDEELPYQFSELIRDVADRAADALEALASLPQQVTSRDEFEALPVDTLVRAEFIYPGLGEVPGYQLVLRAKGEGGASSGGASVRAGKYWGEVYGWADKITILFTPAGSGENRDE